MFRNKEKLYDEQSRRISRSSSFGVTYYDVNNAVTTTPELAEKIKVDLTLQDKADAEDITASSSLVLKKLNE
jgi:hypothetical protein